MNEFVNFFRPSHSSPSIVKRLVELAKSDWKQGDEEEQWGLKAIESLLKKLKKDKVTVERLEHALQYRHPSTECVTIPRSLDGRLQVSHRKGLPHVIYCRVWRWPDLQTHQELKSLPTCKFPYSNKQNDICVNPYHYERVEAQGVLPPVLVPRYSEYPENDRRRRPSFMRSSAAFVLNMMHQVAPHSQPSPGALRASNGLPTMVVPQHFAGDQQQPFASPLPMPVNPSMPNSPYDSMIDDDSMQTDELSQMAQLSQAGWPYNADHQMDIDMMPKMASPPSFDHDQLPEPDNWCTISYYELNSRVGEIFNVPASSLTVTVDGFTNPDVNRLCLGRFNNVHRDRNVQKVRDSIGKGILLTNYNGEIYVACLSDYAVFVQSANCSYFRGFHPSTICKIPPHQSLKIFDPASFLQALSRKQVEKDDIFELEKMCFIRLSFVRGWGAEYQRHNITSTPCWIEIRLNGPFQWYERAIADHPGRLMSSMS